MPGVGTIAQVGQYEVPEKYETALRAGIRFFVVRYPKNTINTQSVFGFFDVTVQEMPGMGGDSRWAETWHTGQNASVVFFPQGKTEIALAFVPDDRFYHNRFILADQPVYRIEAMATPDLGIIPGADANVEIQCLRDVLYEHKPIYRVMQPNGREVEFFWTREQAEEKIRETITVTRGQNQFPRDEQPYIKCKIVEDMRLTQKDSTKAMIYKYRGYTNGWTNSDEFKTTIIPMVSKMSRERKNITLRNTDVLNQPGGLHSSVMEVLKGLTPDQRRALLFEQADNVVRSDSDVREMASDLPKRVKLTKTDLARKQLGDLQTMAQERDLPIDGKKRTDLIADVWAYEESKNNTRPEAPVTAESAIAETVNFN